MLTKLQLKPGLNRENTRYTKENGWWDCDKVRFRQGTPEAIGGWVRFSDDDFLGVCRALHVWVSLGGARYIGLGTNLKYYIENGGAYYDVTPLRETQALTNPFTTVDTLTTVTVADSGHGASTGDYVTFLVASPVGGLTLDGEYTITVVDSNSYTIESPAPATSNATGGGSTIAAYQLSTGADVQTPSEGWGVGAWGLGLWGFGATSFAQLRLWSHGNFGEDLIMNPRGGALYTWSASGGSPLSTRAVLISGLPGASDVPASVNSVLVSDISRFVFAFGCTEIGGTGIDPLLIRWSDQESMVDWTPLATNQAGSLRLSIGSEIVSYEQLRQEVLVWTDSALYVLQNLGPPQGWGAQLMGDAVSIVGPNASVSAVGSAFWMGNKKFYVYNGQVQTLKCDVLQYVFNDFNFAQMLQVFAGTVEEFNEVWWFYPSADSTVPNKYVVYNYVESIWYTGNLTRYAWNNSGIFDNPLAAGGDRLISHEFGTDDEYTSTPMPIHAYIESAEFDLEDGEKFSFVRKVIPDITFEGSTSTNPTATLTLYPMKNTGSGFGTSIGGTDNANIVRGVSAPVETFTEQLYIRVRGRQLVIRIESNQLGTTWQAGTMRLELRPDGGRG